ncbi:histidine kinase [Polymorphospora rubra]|uniref:sensor histidine kinase n=1 Tax=Polymorphospora rubra TaxID=338584 RepID=UPI0033D56D41
MRTFDASHPLPWDITLALLVTVASVNASMGLRPVGAPFLLVACGAVVFRRRAPLPALLVAVVALGVGVVVCGLIGEAPPWAYLAVWILLFHVGLRGTRVLVPAAFLAGAAALVAFVGAAEFGEMALDARWTAMPPVAAMSAAALLAGSQMRGAREDAKRHREEATREAVAAERSRIAREMHDLIGHDLSVIASLSAGGQAAARSAPDDAERAFVAIGEVSRASVGQLRHVLRLLRTTEDDFVHPLTPQPGLAQLGALIESVRRAGFRIDDERHGDLAALPPGHQLAVFRLVQEALTNTMRHSGAGSAASVRIAIDAEEVVVSIADRSAVPEIDRPGVSSDGHGIIGMRERVDTLGGTLEAGPTVVGWRVRATIPREGRDR